MIKKKNSHYNVFVRSVLTDEDFENDTISAGITYSQSH